MTPTKNLRGEPLTDAAIENLKRFRAIHEARQRQSDAEEAQAAREKRAGVHVLTDEEKKAFLAQRPDLK